RFRQPGWYKNIAFSPDGKVLASKTESYALHFWDPATGRLLGRIDTTDPIFSGFAYSPDGKQIASVGGLRKGDDPAAVGAIRLWDAATHREIRTIQVDKFLPSVLVYAPDGKMLFTNGGDQGAGSVCVWEVATGIELLRYKLGPGSIRALAVSPDGRLVAAASSDGGIYLWEWQTDRKPHRLQAGEQEMNSLAFAPDGRTLAAGGSLMDGVYLWDVPTRRLRWHPAGYDSAGQGLAFSPDGKLLATTVYGWRRATDGNGVILLWDAATGQLLKKLPTPGDNDRAVAFSTDGRWLAAGSDNGVHVWDRRTYQEVGATDAAHRAYVTSIAVSAHGLMATASDDYTVRLWEAATGRPRGLLQHHSWVRAVALSPDGKRVASSSLDDTVCLWDAATGRLIYRLAGHGDIGGRRVVAFTADGKRLLSFGDDFYLRVTDVATGKALREFRLHPSGVKVPDQDADPSERDRILTLGEGAFSADGRVFVLAIWERLSVFDTETGKEIRALNTGMRNQNLALSPDGKLLLVTGWGKSIQTKLPNGQMRFSTAPEHPLEWWDLTTGQRVRQIILPGSMSSPVAIAADGKRCAAALDKPAGKIRIWDEAGGVELPALSGFRGGIMALAFAPDGRSLVAGMTDTTVLIWDIKGKP
ncbi:MAG: PD40 domain-containing protein, partial [Planctomycetes bacterium]|nr:PD40 domain-containing protein [Planctomycetota bacterium]